MRSILSVAFVIMAIFIVACDGSTVERTQDVDQQLAESTSVNGSINNSDVLVGEIPTPIPIPESEPEPTPASLPEDGYVLTSEDLQILEQLTADPREVGDKLITETELFKIEYLISNQQFFVLLKTLPVEEAKLAAEEWFMDQGFSPQSLCLIRVNFQPSDLTIGEWDAELDVPTGCDIPSS